MYNFFSNKLKLKAFEKALKQVEAEGFYANLAVNEDTMPILPDLSKAVASLSGKKAKEGSSPEVVNVKSLEASLDSQKATPGKERPQTGNKYMPISESEASDQNRSKLYESLFKSSPTFLSDDELDSPEFLDDATDDFVTKPKLSSTAEMKDKVDANRARTFANFAERVKARREEQEKKANEEALKAEIPKIEPDIELPEMEKEPEPEPKPAEVKVEVVADIPKPEPTKTKTISKTIVITKEQTPAPKPKTKRKPTTKKKRKYDADISGGFNY